MPEDRQNWISVRGARTHNLRSVSLDIPRDQLVVVTGLSGSGKSSLAFDTLYAEGQRKYVESLSAYARQFLGQMVKPDVDQITGLPPTIAIAQQTGRSNPRSTVATTTEVYDYLRLLFARVGTPYCPRCGRRVHQQTIPRMVDAILGLAEQTKVMVLAPLVRDQKGEHKEIFNRVMREGFVRVRLDGEVYEAKNHPIPDKARKHTIEVVVDRLVIKPGLRTRLTESVEAAVRLSGGLVVVASQDASARGTAPWQDAIYSERYACTRCNVNLPELEPRIFSFNSPHGACERCDGLGTVMEFDAELVVPDPSLSLEDGAIDAWRRGGQRMTPLYARLVRAFCERFKVSPATPYQAIPRRLRDILMNGTSREDEQAFGFSFEGVLPNLDRRWKSTESDAVKNRLHAYLSERPCTACHGARLRPESLAVRIGPYNINDLSRLSIDAAAGVFAALQSDGQSAPTARSVRQADGEASQRDQPILSIEGEAAQIARPILQEIRQRLQFMIDVGIGYLTLDRTSNTLSGGEAQRIRLATQVGSGLVGVCYVLDEPTVGLHQRDNARLIATLRRLVALGNTVIVVEHDVDAIQAADWVVDVGPGAGAHGGRILANGPRETLLASTESVTARYLRGEVGIETPQKRRRVAAGRALDIQGARENNLKSIDVRIPLDVFCCVTGVSGSGKSTLVNQVLLPALRRRLTGSREPQGAFDKIVGVGRIDKVIEIDQSPIGRTPRSNPATYTGVFDLIRDLYAQTREARIRGYGAGRFSFNVKGGRCEACQGQGTKRIEMHFLPDIFVECAECRGTRYNRETLEIRYRGRSIADVLAMRVEEAIGFFDSFSNVKQHLRALDDVGLGYIALGQSSTTLSGGEAQRVKLAAELGTTAAGRTLYVLDEPTTGLHFADIHRLVDVLNRLCNLGHSILVIEHNLDVVKQADWIIDLGPEGGDAGGTIVAEGPPEQVAAQPGSPTGRYLRRVLPR